MSEFDWAVQQAARWAGKWRDIQNQALELAESMTDREAQRHMFFIAQSYGLLAKRAEERRDRLLRCATAERDQAVDAE